MILPVCFWVLNILPRGLIGLLTKNPKLIVRVFLDPKKDHVSYCELGTRVELKKTKVQCTCSTLLFSTHLDVDG